MKKLLVLLILSTPTIANDTLPIGAPICLCANEMAEIAAATKNQDLAKKQNIMQTGHCGEAQSGVTFTDVVHIGDISAVTVKTKAGKHVIAYTLTEHVK